MEELKGILKTIENLGGVGAELFIWFLVYKALKLCVGAGIMGAIFWRIVNIFKWAVENNKC
jgi:hypothetical protein